MQTALGVAWVLLQPLSTMVVFSVIFGRLAGMPSEGVPYPIFTLCGLLPWQMFAHSLTESSNSLVANQSLITKVYFPRLVIPVSAALASCVDFGISFCLLLLLMAWFGIPPTTLTLALPVFLFMALLTAVAAGLWLSALNVRYRDVRYTIPFLTQFWLFATPIAYPSSIVPEQWRAFYGLNPMVGVVEGFRWALLGTGEGLGGTVWVSVASTAVLLISGLVYFSRMERFFADVI